jgi:death on curing protein
MHSPNNSPLVHWLDKITLIALHAANLRLYGGLHGPVKDDLLESALARPQQLWHYEPGTPLATLACYYCFGIVRNHPFADGNKRMGLLAMGLFLKDNGFALKADKIILTNNVFDLAARTITEDDFMAWVHANIQPVS